jgi:hypothetical protein
MEKETENRRWYEHVFDSLDFPDVPRDAGVNIEGEPPWVVNVLKELVQQVMPTVQIRKPTGVTPREVGRYIGQLCGNFFAIGDAFTTDPETLKRNQAVMEQFEKNRHLPAVEMTLNVASFCERSLLALAPAMERFDSAVMDSFKAALNQPSRAEAADFFQGFTDGISKPGLTANATSAGATTATPIYQRLFSERRQVEKLKSVRELREFLLQRGLSEQVLGDPKRLEKLCERVGLSFGRGRPKRAK